jgi:hypothetical protein
MPADQRKVIGATVHALAAHVTALSECTRRYGSNNRKKLLDGVVIRVDTKRTQTGRTSTTVVAEYQLGSDGVTKTKGSISDQPRLGPLLCHHQHLLLQRQKLLFLLLLQIIGATTPRQMPLQPLRTPL